MKKISTKELSQLADIIRLVEIEKSNKQLQRFLNRLKALNKKYDTNELRKEVNNLIELVNMKEPMSLDLRFLQSLLKTNLDVDFLGNKVVGFYLPPDQQLIPEPIPIRIIDRSNSNEEKARMRVLLVEFPGFKEEEIAYWQNLGFYEAIPLPYEHRKIKGISVLVVKPLLRSNSAAKECGFSPSIITITPETPQLWSLVRDSIEMKESMRTRHRFGRGFDL
jgi:hypothetical protein